MEGNGDIRSNANNLPRNGDDSVELLNGQIKSQRILNEAQKFREQLSEKVNKDLEDFFEAFMSDVEQINQSDNPAAPSHNTSLSSTIHRCNEYREQQEYISDSIENKEKKERGELPDKEFVARRSLLTDLFEISHIRSIYNIFVAILIIFSINTVLMDIIEKGSVGLDFGLIQWGFGKISNVLYIWMCMQLGTLLVVYPGFYAWTSNRPEGKAGVMDLVFFLLYIAYQIAFFIIPLRYIIDNNLPPASAVIVTTEQLRLLMKAHAFVRENLPKVIAYNSKDNKDHEVTDMCPDFSKYLYFLFAPTLVYRNSYPRTSSVRWSYVVSNFMQVLGCVLYVFYIFERFCVPVFQNFNKDSLSPKAFLVSVFGCMLPGALVLLIGFFAILHSWFNAFAEMLRFADRMFYKDWWNTTSFSSYYRTWNIVVHDWLYTYIYKDCHKLLGPKYRGIAMALVFLLSALVHEYVLVMALGFFYPVLFVMFMGAGFGFIFVKGKGRGWNVFLWLALFMGMGILMCAYSMEYFARINCPINYDHFLDYMVPRSWTCDFDAIERKHL